MVFSSMHFSSGVLERACRAVVGKASVNLGLVLGWWPADHRQDVRRANLESETASDTTLNCFSQVWEGC